jgi:hypothetical protein
MCWSQYSWIWKVRIHHPSSLRKGSQNLSLLYWNHSGAKEDTQNLKYKEGYLYVYERENLSWCFNRLLFNCHNHNIK